MQKSIIIIIFLTLSFFLSSTQSIPSNQPIQPSQHSLQSQTINSTQTLWPIPKRISSNSTTQTIQFDLSQISFKIEALPSDNIQSIIDFYIVNVFKLDDIESYQTKKQRRHHDNSASMINFSIIVKNARQVLPESIDHQRYQLTIRQNNNWDLIAEYYPGFVRGFETFSQLIQKNQLNGKYFIRNRPILIDDQPDLVWRGLMIDTSRHYLPVQQIKKIIDGAMYNKMNVLHWHIVDQDSFPMQVPARPQLANYGSVGGKYSPTNLKQIQSYANQRAIRVIPQYDTPAHTRSWGRSPSLSNITFQGEYPFQGQFDPTINLTYQVVTDVAKHINSIFTDKYVHLGGDQVHFQVWDEHPSIKQWMKNNNIKDYDQLQIYYRKKQREILKNINSTKKAIYWANQQINLPVDPTDVIQWWGDTANLDQVKIHKNQIILSNYDLTYLDVGMSDELGDPYGQHISWRDMYKFTPKIQGVNIIGGQACMWAQTTYQHNIEQKIWIRGSVIAERLWNMGVDINGSKGELLNIVRRLIAQRKRMVNRGFKVSPVTVGLCEKDPVICFG